MFPGANSRSLPTLRALPPPQTTVHRPKAPHSALRREGLSLSLPLWSHLGTKTPGSGLAGCLELLSTSRVRQIQGSRPGAPSSLEHSLFISFFHLLPAPFLWAQANQQQAGPILQLGLKLGPPSSKAYILTLYQSYF